MNFSEFSLIDYIKTQFSDLTPRSMTGIGDDCAVLPYIDSQSLVITTDLLVEQIHFLCDKISAFDLGRKAAAVNLSDIAAMGATPIGMTLSIAVTRNVQDDYIKEFINGIRSFNLPLLGGDTTASQNDFIISITALGVAQTQHIKRRCAAKTGDIVYVTGLLGDSSAGLNAMLNHINAPILIQRHNCPVPHLEQGVKLGAHHQVHAMMDVSDGIASDLRHILKASGVSALLDTHKLPLSAELMDFCKIYHHDPLQFAVAGGEDYVLLFTASIDATFDFEVFPIGQIIEGEGEITWTPDPVDFHGFTHF